jgi:AMMECR1 domain-containing protein
MLASVWGTTGQAQPVSKFQQDRSGAGVFALNLARRALDAYCLRRERLTVPQELPPLLRQRAGVFVSTMDRNGAPRCCMGLLYPRGSTLAADIIEAATMAAAHDLRFPPLQPAELANLRVIVSILDPPQPVLDPLSLDPVTDGLAARGRLRTGVVLPGETADQAKFVHWARIRAGAGEGEAVTYLKLKAIRFSEATAPTTGGMR